MKRSTGVRLLLLGSSVGANGCGSAALPVHQQHYESLEQCVHDWGDPADCRRETGSGGTAGAAGSSGGGSYFGPRYYWDYGSNRPVVVAPDGSTHSVGAARVTSEGSVSGGVTARAGSFARGGFGSVGHGFAAGE